MVALFALASPTAFAGRDWAFSQYVFSGIFLVGGLVGTAWTLFVVRAGRISMVSSNTGSVHTSERRKEPVLFFVVVVMYLAAGIFFTVAGVVFLLP